MIDLWVQTLFKSSIVIQLKTYHFHWIDLRKYDAYDFLNAC